MVIFWEAIGWRSGLSGNILNWEGEIRLRQRRFGGPVHARWNPDLSRARGSLSAGLLFDGLFERPLLRKAHQIGILLLFER